MDLLYFTLLLSPFIVGMWRHDMKARKADEFDRFFKWLIQQG